MKQSADFLRNAITDKTSVEEMIDLFRQVCFPMNEEDMLLFETGTYDFTGENLFYFSLTKQVENEDDDEYTQLHLDILYLPDDENKAFHKTVWDEDLEEEFFDYIKKSEAFEYAKHHSYVKTEIYAEET